MSDPDPVGPIRLIPLTGHGGVWLPIGVMRTNFATATAQATVPTVVFAVPARMAATSYAMWFTSAKHANKRFTRPPREVSH